MRSHAGLPRTLAPLGCALAALTALTVTGCLGRLDMAHDAHPDRAHTTISYTGVRSGARQFPDYEPIDASILKPGAATAPKPKGGAGAK